MMKKSMFEFTVLSKQIQEHINQSYLTEFLLTNITETKTSKVIGRQK